MTLGEKLPKDYDPGKIEAILEKFERKVVGLEKVNKDSLRDLSKEFKGLVAQVEEDLNERIDSGKGDGGTPMSTRLPVPNNLKCFEAVAWGFAHVDPFQRVKWLGKIKGYDFYGSNNPFVNPKTPGDTDYDNVLLATPQDAPFVMVGTHYGTGTEAAKDTYLNTQHPTDEDLSWVLDNRLVKVLPENRLIIENINRSTKGTVDQTVANELNDSDGDFVNKGIKAGMYAHKIGGNDDTYWAEVLTVAAGVLTLDSDIFEEGDSYEVGTGRITGYKLLNKKYEIQAQGVEWVQGDKWRIRQYPQTKLFSIGSFATFTKRSGNFYVKARSVGGKGMYGAFTEQVTSEGLSSDGNVPPVPIVYPIHFGSGDDPVNGQECTMNGGFPECQNHGVLTWDQITAGTREIAHYDLFGFERSIFELVWEEIDVDEPVIYKCRRESGDEIEEEAS